MTPVLLLSLVGSYFLVLIVIAQLTSRHADNAGFFIGNRKSPWYIVAFGMIGASLSGITFISVPGWVITSQFTYMQMVLGYLLGYFVIAHILLPIYYKSNLTSIYTYLENRFGITAYKTGASFFLLSRLIGASFRLYLMAHVLQITAFNALGVPFEITVGITILLIWLYTFRGGIKTIIWTDTLQTLFMLTAIVAGIIVISKRLDFHIVDFMNLTENTGQARVFVFDNPKSKLYFFKYFFSGVFITIVMTGLDQDMMQKNLSCHNLKEAQKNMHWFSFSLVPVNLLFLCFGLLLIQFANHIQFPLPENTDNLFPLIATSSFVPPMLGLFFILGLVAAAYSSADSALTALTTSFTVDILETKNKSEAQVQSVRRWVHVGISLMLFIIILIFKTIANENIITSLFTAAGYTYGPLLGLYFIGIFTKLKLKKNYIPVICILAPVISYILDAHSIKWFGGYEFQFEILIVNGLITCLGLWLIREKN